MTGHPEVLDLLGAALGDGVLHPDQADEIELILQGLAHCGRLIPSSSAGSVRRAHCRPMDRSLRGRLRVWPSVAR
jgi:hypothetical protein